MKTNMKDLNKLVESSLTKKEAKYYKALDEQNVFEMFIGLFQGKNKWLMVVMNMVLLVFFVLFVYCLVLFFNSESIQDMLRWGLCAIILLIAICMLKLFAWLQMDKNTVIRKMQRLELQILSLSRRL